MGHGGPDVISEADDSSIGTRLTVDSELSSFASRVHSTASAPVKSSLSPVKSNLKTSGGLGRSSRGVSASQARKLAEMQWRRENGLLEPDQKSPSEDSFDVLNSFKQGAATRSRLLRSALQLTGSPKHDASSGDDRSSSHSPKWASAAFDRRAETGNGPRRIIGENTDPLWGRGGDTPSSKNSGNLTAVSEGCADDCLTSPLAQGSGETTASSAQEEETRGDSARDRSGRPTKFRSITAAFKRALSPRSERDLPQTR